MLRQLAWIKWLLMGIVVAFAVPIATGSWFMWKAVSPTSSSNVDCVAPQSEVSFQEKGKTLLLSGKEQELLTLAASRETTFPKDPHVHLYRARAHFQLHEFDKAIESFNVAEAISPGWRQEYTGPYIKEAKRQLAISKSSNSSAAVDKEQTATADETYELQVKKASDQQQRMDQLLSVQERHAKRFDAILERWERQAGLKTP